jgi:hypothetical protein
MNKVYIQPLTTQVVIQSPPGTQKLSAYQVVIQSPGLEGPSAYQIALENGFIGTQADWLASLVPTTGVVPGTYTKVGVDSTGRVTTGTTLVASDIPNLAWSILTVDSTPNTLAGYGIIDGVSLPTYLVDKTHIYTVLSQKADPDPQYQFTKSLTLSTDWQDTGIAYNDLATGTYLVQLYANDISSGGTNNNEYYSGVLSWYASSTSSSLEIPTDELVLHRAGGSGEGGLYLRTYRSSVVENTNLKLQIYSNTSNASSANYVFKFRKMI